jgi:hypothetical protein
MKRMRQLEKALDGSRRHAAQAATLEQANHELRAQLEAARAQRGGGAAEQDVLDLMEAQVECGVGPGLWKTHPSCVSLKPKRGREGPARVERRAARKRGLSPPKLTWFLLEICASGAAAQRHREGEGARVSRDAPHCAGEARPRGAFGFGG